MRTVLLFALPEEHRAFRKTTGPWRLSHRTPFKTFLHSAPSRELVLVETGMGRRQQLEALPWLLEQTHPDLIISAGFAGSLHRNLLVGDVCLVEAFVYLDADHHAQRGLETVGPKLQNAGFDAWDDATGSMKGKRSMTLHLNPKADEVSRWTQLCHEHRLRRIRAVTVNQPYPKALWAGMFADRASVMDMESYFAVRFCSERRIPFLGLRAVSDGLRDEIDFDLTAISDERGRVGISRVLTSVVRSPGLMRSYYRSWKRSQIAARNLGKVLTGLMALPAEELGALAESLSYDNS